MGKDVHGQAARTAAGFLLGQLGLLVPAMVEFAVRHRVGGVIANTVKGGEGLWKARRFDELLEVFRRAHQAARERGIALMVPNQIEGRAIEEDFVAESNFRGCPTYLEEVFVRYNGDVCPCNMMNPFVYGNLRRDSLEDVLRSVPSPLFDHLMSARSRHPYCVNCYISGDGRHGDASEEGHPGSVPAVAAARCGAVSDAASVVRKIGQRAVGGGAPLERSPTGTGSSTCT